MVPQFTTNNMKIRNREIDLNHILKEIASIAAGTAIGLLVYLIFLHFNIAVFGWNLGLIFAPLGAGYAETVIARRLLNKDIGAISAFILFIYTTFYSFILKNPTLGINIITAGSIIVIVQAAFPTLTNYLIMLVLGAVASNFAQTFKKFSTNLKKATTNNIRWETPSEIPDDEIPTFDEDRSNKLLNSLDFLFITGTDLKSRNHENLGMFQSQVIIERPEMLSVKREIIENKRLISIKQGKDECLIKLVETVKENGGNGILDLEIQYGLVGLGGDNIHITAMGIGIATIGDMDNLLKDNF